MCKREKKWQEAVAVLDDMRESGHTLGTVSYNAVIDACGKAKQVDKCLELFDQLHKAGNVPDAVTYTALIDACGRCGMIDRAFSLLGSMRTAHVEPNLITYNALIHACANAGATDAAFQVWNQLRHDGQTVPNVRTFTELIGVCCKAQQLDTAFGLLYQMLAEQVEPSRVTFDILLRASVCANNASRFFELKSLIGQSQIELSEATVQLINDANQTMLNSAGTASMPQPTLAGVSPPPVIPAVTAPGAVGYPQHLQQPVVYLPTGAVPTLMPFTSAPLISSITVGGPQVVPH